MEPHRTLGAYLAPDSKHVSKLLSTERKAKKGDPPIPKLGQRELQRKAMEFQRGIYANHLNKYKGQLMHRQIYTPSMKYGLHVLNTEDAFMAKMQGGVSEALLMAMGYNRKMPKAIRHGPLHLGGAGILNLETARHTCKINHILQHLRMGRATGKMIKIALDWAQLIAGTTTPVMEASEILPHLTEPWIADTHRFLVQHNSGIKIPSLIKPITRRHADQRIMDVMMNLNLSDHEVKDINNCRLFLQVEMIADIAMNQGDKIRDSVRKGECSGVEFYIAVARTIEIKDKR